MLAILLFKRIGRLHPMLFLSADILNWSFKAASLKESDNNNYYFQDLLYFHQKRIGRAMELPPKPILVPRQNEIPFKYSIWPKKV